jgi:Fic family protein
LKVKINTPGIVEYLIAHPLKSSKEIHEDLGKGLIGYATIKRNLNVLLEQNYLETEGKGRATKYKVSTSYAILHTIDPSEYFKTEIDDRTVRKEFNLDLISKTLPQISLFTAEELDLLDNLQAKHTANIQSLTVAQYQKESERLAIDLSWKSSQIEGNTYSLLETERLLKDKETAAGKHKDEATMLLNHKEAIDFIVSNPDYLDPISIRSIEDIHSILMKELGVDRNIRTSRVGITGTNFKPLDNEFQIRDALQQMCMLVNARTNVFEKSLLLLVLLSYIQAFEDGNKRTARIVSNACLISNSYCPISFRTVDSIAFKEAMLIFYEQNNISAIKQIFIEQFEFAVETYF